MSLLDITTLFRFVQSFVFVASNGQWEPWRQGYATACTTLHPESSMVPGQALTPIDITLSPQAFVICKSSTRSLLVKNKFNLAVTLIASLTFLLNCYDIVP